MIKQHSGSADRPAAGNVASGGIAGGGIALGAAAQLVAAEERVAAAELASIAEAVATMIVAEANQFLGETGAACIACSRTALRTSARCMNCSTALPLGLLAERACSCLLCCTSKNKKNSCRPELHCSFRKEIIRDTAELRRFSVQCTAADV